MIAPLTAAELREIEERALETVERGAIGADLRAIVREDVPRLIATVKALQAYRAACWVWEPEGDSGFDRVNAALAVFTTVRGWLDSGRVTIADDEDPESFHECLNEAEFLCRGLLHACRAESTPASRAEAHTR